MLRLDSLGLPLTSSSCLVFDCIEVRRPDSQVTNMLTKLLLFDAGMSQTELVAMLRSRARKSGTQTSHFRGVSLLKQTGKWHAQINVGGKQVRPSAACDMYGHCC